MIRAELVYRKHGSLRRAGSMFTRSCHASRTVCRIRRLSNQLRPTGVLSQGVAGGACDV